MWLQMAKQDSRRNVKLNEENTAWLTKLSEKSVLKTSVDALTNTVVEHGRRWLERIITTKP
jgi:hypothetical protein